MKRQVWCWKWKWKFSANSTPEGRFERTFLDLLNTTTNLKVMSGFQNSPSVEMVSSSWNSVKGFAFAVQKLLGSTKIELTPRMMYNNIILDVVFFVDIELSEHLDYHPWQLPAKCETWDETESYLNIVPWQQKLSSVFVHWVLSVRVSYWKWSK